MKPERSGPISGLTGESKELPHGLGPILLISELALSNHLMGQLQHIVREAHSGLHVVTAAGLLVETQVLRVLLAIPVVVTLTSALAAVDTGFRDATRIP